MNNNSLKRGLGVRFNMKAILRFFGLTTYKNIELADKEIKELEFLLKQLQSEILN